MMARRRKSFSHAKEVYYILCFVAALLIFLFGVLGPEGYREMKKREQELAAERLKTEELKLRILERQRIIDSLKNDPAALEEYLRTQGFGREGDLIQEVPPDPPTLPRR